MKIRLHKSLIFKLTVWYIIILAGLIGAAGVFVYLNFEKRLLEEVDETIHRIGDEVFEEWWHERGVQWPAALRNAEDEFHELQPLLLVVKLDQEQIPVPGESFHSGRQPRIREFFLKPQVYSRFERSDQEWRFLTLDRESLMPQACRVGLFTLRGPYVLQVGLSLGATRFRLGTLAAMLILGGALLLLLASLGGHFIIRRVLQPLHQVVSAARIISAEDLSHRIDARGRQDEIGDLVDTFNDMLARLETSVGKIRRFTADVSHELRTPLTIIRGEIEVCLRRDRTAEEYRKTLESLLEETGRMEAITEDLLLLSRMDANQGRWQQDPVALDELLLKVFENRQPLATAKGIQLILEEESNLAVAGDARLLERLAGNLLDNAIRFTPAGGRVTVRLAAEGPAPAPEADDAVTPVTPGEQSTRLPEGANPAEQPEAAGSRRFPPANGQETVPPVAGDPAARMTGSSVIISPAPAGGPAPPPIPGGPAVVLEVRDTGPGIRPEDLPFIFERFFVGDPSRSRDTGGTGLGLSIVQSVAGLHRATIHVTSSPGSGSRFTVRFPAPGSSS